MVEDCAETTGVVSKNQDSDIDFNLGICMRSPALC